MASAITFGELNYSGSASQDDILAARYIVGLENKRRIELNAILAAQEPPGTPIPLLPVTPAAALKSSYISMLLAIVTSSHASYIEQARGNPGASLVFTDAEIEQIRVNLVNRRTAGESAASIVADTATL